MRYTLDAMLALLVVAMLAMIAHAAPAMHSDNDTSVKQLAMPPPDTPAVKASELKDNALSLNHDATAMPVTPTALEPRSFNAKIEERVGIGIRPSACARCAGAG